MSTENGSAAENAVPAVDPAANALSISLTPAVSLAVWPERVWMPREALLRCLDLLFEADSSALQKARACLGALVKRNSLWDDLAEGRVLSPKLECVATYARASQQVAVQPQLTAPDEGALTSGVVLRDGEAANSAYPSSFPSELHEGESPALRRPDPWADLAHAAGQLLLLRRGGVGRLARYALLIRRDEAWHLCDGRGETLARVTSRSVVRAANAAEATDGLVLRLPEGAQEQQARSAWHHVRWLLRRAWAEVGLASVWINAAQLALPVYSMLIYDKVVNNGTFETLWALTLGLLIFMVTDAALRLVRAWSVERLSSAQAERDDQQLWERLVHAGEPPPNALPRLMAHYRELAASRDFVSSTYLLAIADLPFLLLYLAVIGLVAWPLALVAAGLVGVYAWAGHKLHVRANRLGRESEQVMTTKLARLGSLASCLDLLRSAPGVGLLRRRWLTVSTNAADAESRRRLAAGHSQVLANVMVPLASATMLVAGCYLIEARQLSVGGLIAANLLAARAMALVASAFLVASKWADFKRAAERLESALPKAALASHAGRVGKAEATGRIDVVGLSKQYPGRPSALRKVSFSVEPGERIAILGQPAAGKSTVLRALAGLCQTDSGRILFDGAGLDEIAQEQRVAWLSYKPQDPSLFAGTLADNLRVGAGGRSQGRTLKRALWASGLDDELRSGRLSLGTLIEDGGRNLSGGQRQKIALARALSRKNAIVLLDEPSLGLDPESERQLARRLPEALHGATLIMVTHSGTMLSLAQRVIVMEHGRVVADGAPQDGKLIRRVA